MIDDVVGVAPEETGTTPALFFGKFEQFLEEWFGVLLPHLFAQGMQSRTSQAEVVRTLLNGVEF